MGVHIGQRLRRCVRLACALAVAALLAAPMLLGPALSPIVRALSGADVHHCACGMVQGKCGCAECEIVVGGAHLDDDDVTPAPRPILKSSCDDDAPTTPAFASIPPATLPFTNAIPARASHVVAPIAADVLATLHRIRPPTPPPRSARA